MDEPEMLDQDDFPIAGSFDSNDILPQIWERDPDATLPYMHGDTMDDDNTEVESSNPSDTPSGDDSDIVPKQDERSIFLLDTEIEIMSHIFSLFSHFCQISARQRTDPLFSHFYAIFSHYSHISVRLALGSALTHYSHISTQYLLIILTFVRLAQGSALTHHFYVFYYISVRSALGSALTHYSHILRIFTFLCQFSARQRAHRFLSHFSYSHIPYPYIILTYFIFSHPCVRPALGSALTDCHISLFSHFCQSSAMQRADTFSHSSYSHISGV